MIFALKQFIIYCIWESSVNLYSSFIIFLFINQEEEVKELSKSMMNNKQKRLYNRMQHGIAKKKEMKEILETKRKQTVDGKNEAVKKAINKSRR